MSEASPGESPKAEVALTTSKRALKKIYNLGKSGVSLAITHAVNYIEAERDKATQLRAEKAQREADRLAEPAQRIDRVRKVQTYYRTREEKSKMFDMQGFIEKRQKTEPWVAVEIGPGLRPSGLNRRFTGSSAYIAIEAGINNNWPFFDPETHGTTAGVFQKIRENRQGENIFLIEDYAIDSKQPGRRVLGDQAGHYKLPDECADEVILSYVLGDDQTNFGLVISEARRMLKPGGLLMIFDSYGTVFGHDLDHVGLEFEFASTLEKGTGEPALQFGLYQTDPDILNIENERLPGAMLIMSKPLNL